MSRDRRTLMVSTMAIRRFWRNGAERLVSACAEVPMTSSRYYEYRYSTLLVRPRVHYLKTDAVIQRTRTWILETPWQMLHSARGGRCNFAKARTSVVAGGWRTCLNTFASATWHKDHSARQGVEPDGATKEHGTGVGKQLERGPAKDYAIMGIVSAASPKQTTAQQLLDSIPAIASPSQAFGGRVVVTLLLTPSFAHTALDPDLPLHLMRRLQNGVVQSPLQPVAYTAAVVDRLPSEISPAGTEGLAYMLRPSNTYKRPQEETVDQYDPNAQNPGTIGFSLDDNSPSIADSMLLEVPLARTIFSSGYVSTMVTGSFNYTDGNVLPTRYNQRQLHRQTNIPLPCAAGDREYSLGAPLLPLTPFRTIGNSMGNIVRTVSAALPGDGNWSLKTTQPASQELEAAVSAYFRACELEPTSVNIWALITPSRKVLQTNTEGDMQLHQTDMDRVKQMWIRNSDTSGVPTHTLNAEIKQLIGKGSRLHRVLSGGGGWGKKAGLLSLDPDTRYDARTLRNDEGWDFDFETENDESYNEFDMQKQQKQALGTIVEEGEEVMFLIAPGQSNEPDAGQNLWRNSNSARDNVGTAMFGVIPSTVDEVPDQGCSIPEARGPGIVHTIGLFGALSEGGMALEVRARGVSVCRTKFDIPGARWMTEFAYPAEHDMKQDGGLGSKAASIRFSETRGLSMKEEADMNLKNSPMGRRAPSTTELGNHPAANGVKDMKNRRSSRRRSVENKKMQLVNRGPKSNANRSKSGQNSVRYVHAESWKSVIRWQYGGPGIFRKYVHKKASSNAGKTEYEIEPTRVLPSRPTEEHMAQLKLATHNERAHRQVSRELASVDDHNLELLVGQVVGKQQMVRKVFASKNTSFTDPDVSVRFPISSTVPSDTKQFTHYKNESLAAGPRLTTQHDLLQDLSFPTTRRNTRRFSTSSRSSMPSERTWNVNCGRSRPMPEATGPLNDLEAMKRPDGRRTSRPTAEAPPPLEREVLKFAIKDRYHKTDRRRTNDQKGLAELEGKTGNGLPSPRSNKILPVTNQECSPFHTIEHAVEVSTGCPRKPITTRQKRRNDAPTRRTGVDRKLKVTYFASDCNLAARQKAQHLQQVLPPRARSRQGTKPLKPWTNASVRRVVQTDGYLPIGHDSVPLEYDFVSLESHGGKEEVMTSERFGWWRGVNDNHLASHPISEDESWQLLRDMDSGSGEGKTASSSSGPQDKHGWDSAQLQRDVLALTDGYSNTNRVRILRSSLADRFKIDIDEGDESVDSTKESGNGCKIPAAPTMNRTAELNTCRHVLPEAQKAAALHSCHAEQYRPRRFCLVMAADWFSQSVTPVNLHKGSPLSGMKIEA
nr:hypothetical protein CFP56_44415 [Quercus suber]